MHLFPVKVIFITLAITRVYYRSNFTNKHGLLPPNASKITYKLLPLPLPQLYIFTLTNVYLVHTLASISIVRLKPTKKNTYIDNSSLVSVLFFDVKELKDSAVVFLV